TVATDGTASLVGVRAMAPAARAVPHSAQNRAPGRAGSPHVGHVCRTAAPQWMQNFLPAGVCPPQALHATVPPLALMPRLECAAPRRARARAWRAAAQRSVWPRPAAEPPG